MTAANHVLSGAIIGAVVKEPALAALVALLSHFVLDVVPHFGFKNWEDRSAHKLLLNYVLISDGLILAVIGVWLLILNPGWQILLCASLAASPDLAWVYRFTIKEKFGKFKPPTGNKLTQFHAAIQKLEFKQGLIIEYVALVVFIAILNKQI